MPAKKTHAKSYCTQSQGVSLPAAAGPKASRPVMPTGYGVPQAMKGSLPWDWAPERLTNSHNYLITTVRPDGRPHTMVVWGIWLDNAYYFSTGVTTLKARNLTGNPNCVVCNENVAEAVIVEGSARQLAVDEIPKAAFDLYKEKYAWKLDPGDGAGLQDHTAGSLCDAGKAVPGGSHSLGVRASSSMPRRIIVVFAQSRMPLGPRNRSSGTAEITPTSWAYFRKSCSPA